jgi:hypothetical protein
MAGCRVGTYRHGWLTTPIRELGTFTVFGRHRCTKNNARHLENAVKNRLFRIRVADEASGISAGEARSTGNGCCSPTIYTQVICSMYSTTNDYPGANRTICR